MQQTRKLAIYTRYEMVQKSVEELGLSELLYGHDAISPVYAITLVPLMMYYR